MPSYLLSQLFHQEPFSPSKDDTQVQRLFHGSLRNFFDSSNSSDGRTFPWLKTHKNRTVKYQKYEEVRGYQGLFLPRITKALLGNIPCINGLA